MPRGIPGSGPYAGKNKKAASTGKKTKTVKAAAGKTVKKSSPKKTAKRKAAKRKASE